MSFLVYFSRKCTSSNRNRRQMNCFLKCFASQQIYGHNKTYIAYKKLAPMLHTPGNVHFLFIFIHIDTNRGKMHLQKCETNSNKLNGKKRPREKSDLLKWILYYLCNTRKLPFLCWCCCHNRGNSDFAAKIFGAHDKMQSCK